jgi:hypothetical protein
MPMMTLDEYRASDLRLEESIVGRLGYVHDFFLGFDYEVVVDLPAEPRDLVVIMDNKSHRSKFEQLGMHDGGIVVVAAGGDGSFRSDLLPGGMVPPNVVAGFTINNEVADGRMTSVPLGVRVERAELFKQPLHADADERDRLLYANFSAGPLYPRREGKPHIRHRLRRQLEDSSWVELEVALPSRDSEERLFAHYSNMARHKFALSPEGLGVDCYRHWESLYLGTIPIVRRSLAMSSFSDLPILFTEDYTEIDRPYLEEQWDHFSSRSFKLERLTASHYRSLFGKAIARLKHPKFLCWGFRGTNDEHFLDRLGLATHG